MRTYHESQGKPTYVVKELRPAPPRPRACAAAAPVRLTRVLFLTESFHPVLGGGERHIRELARRLAASGMPATVVTRRGEAGWPAEETLDGVRVVRVPPARAGPARASTRWCPRALARWRASARATTCWWCAGTRVLGLPGAAGGARAAASAWCCSPR